MVPHHMTRARAPGLGPRQLIRGLWQQRRFLRAMIVHEIVSKYRGSYAGVLWYILHNLCLVATYTFVFGAIFKAPWHIRGNPETTLHFAPVLFLGLIIYNVFADCVARSPTLVTGNPSYVKKVVFPLDLLPLVAVAASLFNAAVALCVFLALTYLLGTPIAWTVLWLPLVIVPVALLALGFSWFLASLGVFIRYTSQAVGPLVTGLLFVSPIFYPATAVPEAWRWLLSANPLSPPIEQAREAVFLGNAPDMAGLCSSTGVGLVVAYGGWLWFQSTRKGFADVL
jgi:lipopolysaccharide transport system permease protein